MVELAKNNATWSGFDSDALQFFAIDVYAFDVANPGVGCTGQPAAVSSVSAASTSAAVAAVAAATVTPTPWP